MHLLDMESDRIENELAALLVYDPQPFNAHVAQQIKLATVGNLELGITGIRPEAPY